MQPWVDRHPIWFGVADVLFGCFTFLFVISWWSGWAMLARRFRDRNKFTGSRWRFQSGQMRWMCGYNNCLTVGANSEGLFLSMLPIFSLFHPPLFIPWTEISYTKKTSFFSAGVRFLLGNEFYAPLWVREQLAERLRGAAGGGYPIEKLG